MVARYFPVVAVTLMVLADLPMTAVAQQTDPVWLVPLEQQMEKEWGCDVNYFLNHQEYQLGNNKIYEAKVQCVDGRQFDASRTGERASFVIRACEPVVC